MANREHPGAHRQLASQETSTRPVYISQRLNVCYRDVRLAVINRQASVIVDLAREQHEGGADYLDLCAAGLPDERGSLAWMLGAVQQEVDCPLVLDSADPGTLLHGFGLCVKPPIINAISVSAVRDGVARDLMCLPARSFIISAYDPKTSNNPADRIHALREVLNVSAPGHAAALIADPLFYPQRFDAQRWDESCRTAREIRQAWPDLGLLCAVGNVTFRARTSGRATRLPGTTDRTWSHAEVANRALAEGFDWIICDVMRLGPDARAASGETGQRGSIVL